MSQSICSPSVRRNLSHPGDPGALWPLPRQTYLPPFLSPANYTRQLTYARQPTPACTIAVNAAVLWAETCRLCCSSDPLHVILSWNFQQNWPSFCWPCLTSGTRLTDVSVSLDVVWVSWVMAQCASGVTTTGENQGRGWYCLSLFFSVSLSVSLTFKHFVSLALWI